MEQADDIFQIIIPGKRFPGDTRKTPENIQVGENCKADSGALFRNFRSKLAIGLKLGNNVTLFRSHIATEENGYVEIGDFSFLSNCSIACYNRIIIGKYVFIGGGATIVDTDFHPLEPAERIADTIAISTVGNKNMRPKFESFPVIIEDDVWIGYNATILKGVTIGKGAVIEPGSLILKDVRAGAIVSGNPAKLKSQAL